MIHTRPPGVAHRSHRRVPRHREVPGRLSDGVLRGTDPAGDPGPGTFTQHRRGAISSDSSDHLRAGHAGTPQRHSRLARTSTPAGLPAAGPGPRHAGGRDRSLVRRRSRTNSGPRWSPPRATTRRSPRPAAGRPRRTRRARPVPTRRYRRVPSVASWRCSRRAATSRARPLTAPVDALSLRDQRTRPHASSRRARKCRSASPHLPTTAARSQGRCLSAGYAVGPRCNRKRESRAVLRRWALLSHPRSHACEAVQASRSAAQPAAGTGVVVRLERRVRLDRTVLGHERPPEDRHPIAPESEMGDSGADQCWKSRRSQLTIRCHHEGVTSPSAHKMRLLRIQ